MSTVNYVAPCLLGIEGMAADELRRMEIENVSAENGRVLFSGTENIIARANIGSRYCERILILIGEFSAQTFEQLFEQTKKLPWERWIGKTDIFPVKGYSLNSKLASVSSCQSIIKKAVVERLKEKYNISWFEETGSLYQIQFAIMKDKVSLMIDTSGAGLHKRGYRPHANIAPIKETLAAAMANLARLRDSHTLYDPFCGSGTILIEGTMLAHNIAPGIKRSFAAQKWRNVDELVWREERARALDLIRRKSNFTAYGSDIDPEALEIAAQNAKNQGISSKIKLKKQDVRDFKPETENGVIICNPPYGERMMDIKEAEGLYRIMGKVFEQKPGFSYYIISSNDNFEKIFGRHADRRRKLYNGMIKCQVYMYFNRRIKGLPHSI